MFPDKIKDICSLKADFNDEAMVGLDAMQRANSTLEDFCRSYFMFHDLDASKPQSIFRYLPILSFTESYIYQLDCLNESLLHEPVGSHNVLKEAAFVSASDDVTLPSTLVTCKRKSSSAGSVHAFLTDPFRQLVLLLQRHGLMTERIGEELRGGEEYWKLERQLCSAMINKEEISIQVVMRAIHLKSFDYRVLNLLLFNVRGEKVDNIFMDFLSASEFLVEVADDLFDYEVFPPLSHSTISSKLALWFSPRALFQDDVLENNFNILRMFVRIYGPSAAPTMLARCITEGEEKYIRLLHGLDPDLSHKYQVRCEEATREGGKGSGPPLGTWNIPTIITDEELYRSNISAMSP
uniref:Uncharacterized protein n=1 Tax=Kalanchoe fedtschenkoi TaxID=63787 RepID=A0A7N0VJS4_KALFE